MNLFTRNVKYIISKEKELFERVGMEKIGYEGYNPNPFNGGEVWYIGKFPNENVYYTLRFTSWFGHIKLSYMNNITPVLAQD